MSKPSTRQDYSQVLAKSEHRPSQLQHQSVHQNPNQNHTENISDPTGTHTRASTEPAVPSQQTRSLGTNSGNNTTRMDGVWNLGMVPNPTQTKPSTQSRPRSTTVSSIDSLSIKPISGGHSLNVLNSLTPANLTINTNVNPNTNVHRGSQSTANGVLSSGLGIANDDQRSINSVFISTRNNSALSVQAPPLTLEFQHFFNHDNGSQMSDGNTASSGAGIKFGSGTSSMASLGQNAIPATTVNADLPLFVPVESPTFVFSDLVNLFNSNKDEYTLVSKGNDIIGLLQKYPNLQHDLQLSKILPKLCFLMYHKSLEVRAVGFKAVRYLVGNTNDLSLMIVYGKLLIFIIRTLSNSNSSFVERLELVKLIRKIMYLPPNGVDYLSIGVIKALIKLIRAETDMDPATSTFSTPMSPPYKLEISSEEELQFVKLNIETICEITLLKPQLSFYSGGFNLLLQCVLDTGHFPVELSVICVEVIMKLLDWQFSRKYLRNGLDLNLLVLIFSTCADEEDPTDMTIPNDGKRKRKSITTAGLTGHTTGTKKKKMTSSTVNQLQRTSVLITMMLKHFNGVICFTMNDGFIIGNLLENLKRRNNKVKDLILDILFDVLLIKPLPWAKSCPLAQWLAKYQARSAGLKYSKHEQVQYLEIPKFFLSYSLTNHYVGLLTLVLIRLGIIDMLSQVIEDEKTPYALVEKLTDLLSHILRLGTHLVPPELLDEQLTRHRASNSATIYRLDGFIHKLQAAGNVTSKFSKLGGIGKPFIDEHAKAQQQVNLQGRLNISNEEFKAMIVSTRVLEIKKYEDWNLPLLIQLVEGPLRNPKRFDEVVERNPKFLKRILSFYRPFKFRFCNLSINSRYKEYFITLGCLLLDTFLQVVPQGVKFLANNKLLAQLSEVMAQIDPYSGVTARDPIFSKKKLENNLGFGYLQFIGVLSRYESGIAILESWQFVNILNDLVDYSQLINKNNYFLWNLFMYIDLTKVNSPFRIIFWKLMIGANLKLRLKVMEKLIGPQLLRLLECQSYVCEILVELLMDLNKEIIEKLIDFLDILLNEVVDTDIFLEYFISLKPSVRVLKRTPKGKVLVLKCLGSVKGFHYLQQQGFVDKELQENFNLEVLDSFRLLETIERLIQHQLSSITRSQWSHNTDMSFIKQLLNTEDGLLYFRSKKQQLLRTAVTEIIQLFPLALGEKLDPVIIEHDQSSGLEILGSMRSDISPTKSLNQTIPTPAPSHYASGKDAYEDLYSNPQGLARLKQNLWLIGLIASSKYGIELIDPMGSAHIWNHGLMDHSPPPSPPFANSAATTPTSASRTSSFTTKSNGYTSMTNAASMNGSSTLPNSGTFTPLKSTATPSAPARSRASTIAQDMNHSSPLALIIELFHKCPIWQIKLCCFYVLGMIALTAEGMEMLDEFGWVSVIDNYNKAQGYCYPNLEDSIGLFREDEVSRFDEGIMDDLKFNGDEDNNGLFLSDEVEPAVTPSDAPGSMIIPGSNATIIGRSNIANSGVSQVPLTNIIAPSSVNVAISRTTGTNTPVSAASNGSKDIYDHQVFTEVTRAPQLTIANENQDNSSHPFKEIGIQENSDMKIAIATKFESDDVQVPSEMLTPISPQPELNEEELEDKLKKRVISLIVHMNSVLSRIERKCKKELMRLKNLIPDLFENGDLFLEVIKLIDKGNYSFASRNFIFSELFDEAKIYESLLKNVRRIRSSTL